MKESNKKIKLKIIATTSLVLVVLIGALLYFGDSQEKKLEKNRKDAEQLRGAVQETKEFYQNREDGIKKQCIEYQANIGRPISASDEAYETCKKYL